MELRTQQAAMDKVFADRTTPISMEVAVSIQQSTHEERKKEEKRKPKPAPKPEEDENLEEDPKHQIDDLA